MSRILVTGATGFVGRALVPALAGSHDLVLAARRSSPPPPDVERPPAGPRIEWRQIGEIGPETDWSAALSGVERVVHLAAHVHHPDGDPADFARINHQGTLRLAAAARDAGVQQLVFLSSVKVNGEASAGRPFRESDPPQPEDAYAGSKWAAEQGLAALAGSGGPAVVILRPPLVYGPGATANFAALARLCRSSMPLPLGAIANRRSLIFVGNLAAAIARVVAAPIAPGCRTYLLRDGEDLSTPELVRRLGAAFGRRPILLPVPAGALRLALRLLGRGGAAARLTGSLAVDDSRFRQDFAWVPPFTVDQGLATLAARSR